MGVEGVAGRGAVAVVDLEPIGAPACLFAEDGGGDRGGALVVAGDAGLGGEGAAVEEVFPEVVGEAQAELGVGAQRGVELGRVVGAGDADAVGGRVLEGALGVPAVEQVAGARLAQAGGVPVALRPVQVAAVDVDDHVVDEVVDVEELLDRRVLLGAGEAGLGEGAHLVPCDVVAVADPVVGHCVVVVALAAEVAGRECGVGAFGGVVDAPVEAVDVEVDVVAAGTDPAHGDLGVAHPLVAHHGAAEALLGVPVDPRVVVVAAQDEGVEVGHGGAAGGEHRGGQAALAETAAEQQAERLLGGVGEQPAGAALDAQAGVDLEVGGSGQADPLRGGRQFEALDRGVGVDAAGTEHLIRADGEREGGQGEQGGLHLRGVALLGGDMGADRVAGLGEPVPGFRVARGPGGHADQVVEEQVAVGDDAADRQGAGLEGGGAQHGGGGDRQRRGEDGAVVLARLGAVGGVADRDQRVRVAEGQAEGVLLEAARVGDGGRVDRGPAGGGGVGRAGRGGGEPGDGGGAVRSAAAAGIGRDGGGGQQVGGGGGGAGEDDRLALGVDAEAGVQARGGGRRSGGQPVAQGEVAVDEVEFGRRQ